MDAVDTSGLTDNVATDCFSAASTFSRAFCSLTFLACLSEAEKEKIISIFELAILSTVRFIP